MKRRDALKNIGLSAGFVIATPTVFSLFQSCTSDVATWTPKFLSTEHGIVLRAIVDVILPKTDTPSATEVNVPEFMDKFADEVISLEEQAVLKTAYDDLISLIRKDYNEILTKVTDEDYKNLLDTQLNAVSKESTNDKNKMSVAQLLNNIKYGSIQAYKWSEVVGETILAYDPVPGASYCGDLMELTGGKSWSI